MDRITLETRYGQGYTGPVIAIDMIYIEASYGEGYTGDQLWPWTMLH